MFPRCKKAGGSIPRPGNLVWHLHVLPVSGPPASSHRPKTWTPRPLAARQCLSVWMSVVCLCMLTLRWASDSQLQTKPNRWHKMDGILLLLFLFSARKCINQSQPLRGKNVGNKTTSTAVTDKRIVCDSKRAERWLTDEMQMKEKTKQNSERQKQSAADQLGHFGTDCPESPVWKHTHNPLW